jgi:FkbM family methyltransferase
MKNIMGWFFTDKERDLIEYLKNNGGVYQKQQRDFAINVCKKRRVSIDIGANVGLWSKDFCENFERVYCFEPVSDTIECLEKNLENYNNFEIFPFALGSKSENGTIKILPGSSGHSVINDYVRGMNYTSNFIKEENIKIEKLDNFNINNIDLIKIDCQGYEYEILLGAEETLIDNDPTLCVELPVRDSEEKKFYEKVVNYLKDLNYNEIRRVSKEVYFQK